MIAYCRNCEGREINTDTGGKGAGAKGKEPQYGPFVGGAVGDLLVPHYFGHRMPVERAAPAPSEGRGEKEGEEYLYVEVDFAQFNGMEANGYQVHLYDLATDTAAATFKTTWTGTDHGPFTLATPTGVLKIKAVGGKKRDYVIVVEER